MEREHCQPNGESTKKRARTDAGIAIVENDENVRRGVLGTVRVFNPDKGWGFILGDDVGGDIFLHKRHVVRGVPTYWIGHDTETKDKDLAARHPNKKVRVKFDLSLSLEGKPQACNVEFLDGEQARETGGTGVPSKRLESSPTCSRCESTVALQLGITICVLCKLPLPNPGCNQDGICPVFMVNPYLVHPHPPGIGGYVASPSMGGSGASMSMYPKTSFPLTSPVSELLGAEFS